MADRVCPKCGAVPGPRLKFCRECGARIDDAPGPASGGGDETIVAPSVRRPEPPAPTPDPITEESGDATVISGALRRPPGVGSAPAAGAGSGDSDVEQKTLVGSAPPSWMEAPPSAPRNMPEGDDEEPVSDEIDMGDDDSGSTILASAPPPFPTEPRAAPPSFPVREVPPTPRPASTPPSPPPPPAPPPSRQAAPASSAGAAIRMEHWSPRQKTELLNLEKAELLVGRDRGDLQYPEDNYLSKKHARFFRDEAGRLSVEDMGTLNGTYRRIRVSEKLQHRDTIFIGRHVFRFELLKFEERDDRTVEGDPLTKVQGIQGTAPRARIVKRQDEGFCGLPFCFGTAKYVLGRTDGTHNFSRDDRMSRRHTQIWFQDGDYWIEDLGSQNGTFLRIRGPTALDTGDVVLVGEQYFKVV